MLVILCIGVVVVIVCKDRDDMRFKVVFLVALISVNTI